MNSEQKKIVFARVLVDHQISMLEKPNFNNENLQASHHCAIATDMPIEIAFITADDIIIVARQIICVVYELFCFFFY